MDTPGPTEAPTATSTVEPTPSPGETWTRPTGGMVMVYVPAGASWCGALDMAGNVSELEKALHG
jgi:hypothetical protein